MNAVACDVQVIATGARPAENGGQRELFTEETTTALVFENGGVLRLSAKVDPGQLLFLTHKETKREVVAQVTRKRNSRPMSCYVEVEFSEPSPGFWGIEFPEKPAPVPANSQQKEAGESAQAEEAILTGEPSAATPAPSAQEIAMLKEEVDALREHLKLLQAQNAAGNSAAPAALPNPSQVPAHAPAHVDAPGEVSQGLPAEVSGALASDNPAPPLASMSLPIGRAEPSISEEALRPKPVSEPKQTVAAEIKHAAMRKDLFFAAFLLAVAGAAWYQNLLPWLPQPKSLFSGTASTIAAHRALHTPQKAANAHADSGQSSQTSEAPATSPSADLPDASQPASVGTAKPSTSAVPEAPEAVKSAPDAARDAAAVQEKPEMDASAGKRSAPPSSKAATDSEAPLSGGASIVPPKLIKSVRAVASPNALRDFSTGKGDSVTFDALVDTSGQVKSMKALSGSASLQSAAMSALKQYRYEPATRHGKPVPAHVTVTIKFLFEP